MVFSDSSWKTFPGNGRSTGAYDVFYQGETIYHGTYFQDQLINEAHKVSTL